MPTNPHVHHLQSSIHIPHYVMFLNNPESIERLVSDTVKAMLAYEELTGKLEVTQKTIMHPDSTATIIVRVKVTEMEN